MEGQVQLALARRLCHTFGHTLADIVRPSPRSTCMPFQNVSEFFGRDSLSIAPSAPAAHPRCRTCTEPRQAAGQPVRTATSIMDIPPSSCLWRHVHIWESNTALHSSRTTLSTTSRYSRGANSTHAICSICIPGRAQFCSWLRALYLYAGTLKCSLSVAWWHQASCGL